MICLVIRLSSSWISSIHTPSTNPHKLSSPRFAVFTISRDYRRLWTQAGIASWGRRWLKPVLCLSRSESESAHWSLSCANGPTQLYIWSGPWGRDLIISGVALTSYSYYQRPTTLHRHPKYRHRWDYLVNHPTAPPYGAGLTCLGTWGRDFAWPRLLLWYGSPWGSSGSWHRRGCRCKGLRMIQ